MSALRAYLLNSYSIHDLTVVAITWRPFGPLINYSVRPQRPQNFVPDG